MEKTINDNGTIRLVPSDIENWLYDGLGSFGKVVDCPASATAKWQEVTDAFKVEWEEKQVKEMEAQL